MRNNSRSIHIRLNLNKPEHQKAWDCLEQLEREDGPSYNQFIAQAIVEYAERDHRKECSLDAEKNELVEICVQKIISAVEDSLQKTLPAYLAGCFAAASGSFVVPQQPQSEEPISDNSTISEGEQISADDIDWDFLGEG